MYQYNDTETISSAVFPGVSFIIRKMTEGGRADFRLKQADAQAKVDDLLIAREAAVKAVQNNPEGVPQRQQLAAIDRDLDRVVGNDANPAWVAWGLVSITGIEINGEPATPANLGRGPESLFQEVLETIKSKSRLNGEEIKNSESPSISGTPVAGETNDTIVPVANVQEPTARETVESTSPAN